MAARRVMWLSVVLTILSLGRAPFDRHSGQALEDEVRASIGEVISGFSPEAAHREDTNISYVCCSNPNKRSRISIPTARQEQWLPRPQTPKDKGISFRVSEANYSLGVKLPKLRPVLFTCRAVVFPRRRYTHRKPKRTKSWCQYYSNSSALRQVLLQGGDISTNPGPTTLPTAASTGKPKCSICERTIARNHHTVQCWDCESQYHFKCAGLSVKDYQQTGSDVY